MGLAARAKQVKHHATGKRVAFLVGLGVTVAVALAPPVQAAEQKLAVPDGEQFDVFGGSVAIDGNVLVVGAPNSDRNTGAVYVYRREQGVWKPSAELVPSDNTGLGDVFGSAVAIDGDTIVASATGYATGRDQIGAVYTFSRDGSSTRTETAILTTSDGADRDEFGRSVAIDGDVIVAGAPCDDLGATNDPGSIYTFARDGGPERTETAKLTASNGSVGDSLGSSVAIEGEAIVAGTFSGNCTLPVESEEGSAYVFARHGAEAREETSELTASDGAPGDAFGFSVAVGQSSVVVGAPLDDSGANEDVGSAYTFSSSGTGVLAQDSKLTASDSAEGDRLGSSVAVGGDRIVVGAAGNDIGAAVDQGSAYAFPRGGAPSRNEAATLLAPDGARDDSFGSALAISGDAILTSAPYDDFGDNRDQGSAYIFFPDVTPPRTLSLKGPKEIVQGRKARFRFGSSEPRSTFRCKLDRNAFIACHSPRKFTTRGLSRGKHTFRVFAIDAEGNADRSPAKRTFKVKRRDR